MTSHDLAVHRKLTNFVMHRNVSTAHIYGALFVWRFDLTLSRGFHVGYMKSQKIHTFPPKPSSQVPASQESWVSIQFLDMFVGSKTLKFQLFPQLFSSLCRSPPAFPALSFPAFGVQTADTLRVFGKFLPHLGLMIPVLSIQVTIAHCSLLIKKKNSTRASFHQHLWDWNQFTKESLTASDGSSTPSRILSPSVSHSFVILGRLTPLSPLPHL